jgi:hypothetical protein
MSCVVPSDVGNRIAPNLALRLSPHHHPTEGNDEKRVHPFRGTRELRCVFSTSLLSIWVKLRKWGCGCASRAKTMELAAASWPGGS